MSPAHPYRDLSAWHGIGGLCAPWSGIKARSTRRTSARFWSSATQYLAEYVPVVAGRIIGFGGQISNLASMTYIHTYGLPNGGKRWGGHGPHLFLPLSPAYYAYRITGSLDNKLAIDVPSASSRTLSASTCKDLRISLTARFRAIWRALQSLQIEIASQMPQ